MRLIGLAVVLTFSLLLAPLAAEAQPAGKVPRVAYLTPWSDSDPGRQRGLEASRVTKGEEGLEEAERLRGAGAVRDELRLGDADRAAEPPHGPKLVMQPEQHHAYLGFTEASGPH